MISPDLLDDKAPALSESTGTDIDWKPSKNLCITEIKKKQKAKSGRNKGQVGTGLVGYWFEWRSLSGVRK